MRKPARKPLRGRPSLSDAGATMLSVRLPNEMLAAIDGIAAERLDKPGRANLIRELLAEALDARARKGGKR